MKTNFNPKRSPGIEDVKRAFDDWRNSRKNNREPIPKELMQKAANLCHYHLRSEVAKALKINYTKLKQYIINEYRQKPKRKQKSNDFIELNLKQYNSYNIPGCEIIIEMRNQQKVTIRTKELSQDSLWDLITRFLHYKKGESE
jgi:hypothetical protein